MTSAEYRAIHAQKPASRPVAAAPVDSQGAGNGGHTRQLKAPKEPAEKHVQLPPPPVQPGPWPAGPWTVRRATSYPDTARVVLTGPSEEFDRLLAHLQVYPAL